MPVEPLDLVDPVDLDLVEEEVVGLVDPVDLDLVEEEVVDLVDPVDLDLVDQTAQKGKKGVLVQVQEEGWDLMAGRLLQTLLEEETMHSRKGE